MRLFSKNASVIINAFAALTAYGGWAIWINYDHGFLVSLQAGMVQGIYAFISTFTVTGVALWVYRHYNGGKKGITRGFCVSFIMMLLIPLGVHTIANTPRIWETIAPGIIWGSGYIIAYLLAIQRKH